MPLQCDGRQRSEVQRVAVVADTAACTSHAPPHGNLIMGA